MFGVATNSSLLKNLSEQKVKPLSSEVNSITWFNGLILGLGKNQNIDGIGLFGEIVNPETPQFQAASNIIKVIAKMLQLNIDTSELDKKIIKKPVEPKKEGPGIG